MFQKGDWVMVKGLYMIPVQLDKDPYVKEILTEGRPVKRVLVTVVDVSNPDCGYTNVDYIIYATSTDFLDSYLQQKRVIDSVKENIARIQDAHNKFLKSTSNFHIT